MKSNNNKGMTLVELLVSLVLLSILLIFTINLFLLIRKTYNESTSSSQMELVKSKLVTYINNDALEYGVSNITSNSNTINFSFVKDENGIAFNKQLKYDSSDNKIIYNCDSCSSKVNISNVSIPLPKNYTFNGFAINYDEASTTYKITINGKNNGKNSVVNIFIKQYKIGRAHV